MDIIVNVEFSARWYFCDCQAFGALNHNQIWFPYLFIFYLGTWQEDGHSRMFPDNMYIISVTLIMQYVKLH